MIKFRNWNNREILYIDKSIIDGYLVVGVIKWGIICYKICVDWFKFS